MSQGIIVTAPLPPVPLELVTGSFMTDLAIAEADVASLTISDASTAQRAADLQQRLTKAGTALEKARTDLKAPLLAVGRAIDTAAKGPQDRIDTMKRTLKVRQVAYDDEQRRIAAEEEKKRQAEIKRLEEERQKKLRELEEKQRAEEAENKRIADEIIANAAKLPQSATASDDLLDFADDTPPPVEKTETEKQIEAVKYAPLAVPAAKPHVAPVGLSFRTTLKLTVTDVNRLPETFVTKTANLTALRAVYTTPWREGQPLPECPGVAFEIDRQPVTR